MKARVRPYYSLTGKLFYNVYQKCVLRCPLQLTNGSQFDIPTSRDQRPTNHSSPSQTIY